MELYQIILIALGSLSTLASVIACFFSKHLDPAVKAERIKKRLNKLATLLKQLSNKGGTNQ